MVPTGQDESGESGDERQWRVERTALFSVRSHLGPLVRTAEFPADRSEQSFICCAGVVEGCEAVIGVDRETVSQRDRDDNVAIDAYPTGDDQRGCAHRARRVS